MTEVPPGNSVPQIPLRRGHDDQWTVRGAAVTALGVIGAGQLLGLILVQLYVGWSQDWSRAFDFGASGRLPHATQQALLVWIQLIVTAIELGLVWWIAGQGGRDRWRALGLHPARIGFGGWAGAIATVFGVKIAATLLVTGVSNVDPKQDLAPFIDLARNNQVWLGFVAAAIAAALIEELVFRGILSRTLEATWLGFWGGAALSSGLFAVIHFQYGPGGQFVVFALGVTFSWLRARSGSLWPAIAGHAVNNAVALLAMKALV